MLGTSTAGVILKAKFSPVKVFFNIYTFDIFIAVHALYYLDISYKN